MKKYILALFALTLSTPALADGHNETKDKIEPIVKTAVFAGGCFWCVEADFEKTMGVIKAESGYAGGPEIDPTYKQVSEGKTGHAEVVKVTYNSDKVSYKDLVKMYWLSVDPTVKDQQFCDKGKQYRTVIFYQTDEEKEIAEKSKVNAEKHLGLPVYTEIVKLDKFYPAEKYHQDYYKKNPLRYKYYRTSCRRDARLDEVWGGMLGNI
jgi:methionine-S-sulfoxide reductase